MINTKPTKYYITQGATRMTMKHRVEFFLGFISAGLTDVPIDSFLLLLLKIFTRSHWSNF